MKKNIFKLFIIILLMIILATFSIRILNNPTYGTILNLLCFIGICFILYLYKYFNKNTPNWFIFKEPY